MKLILFTLLIFSFVGLHAQNASIDVIHYGLKLHVYDSTNRISVEEQIKFN